MIISVPPHSSISAIISSSNFLYLSSYAFSCISVTSGSFSIKLSLVTTPSSFLSMLKQSHNNCFCHANSSKTIFLISFISSWAYSIASIISVSLVFLAYFIAFFNSLWPSFIPSLNSFDMFVNNALTNFLNSLLVTSPL